MPPHAEAAPPALPRRSRDRLAILLCGLAMVAPLARMGARRFWFLDLLTHFSGPALVVTLLALAALVRSRRLAWAIPLVALAIYQAGPIVRYSGTNPVRASADDPARLRILMANLLFVNERYDLVADLIRRERPDVVGLVEVSPEWIAGLEATGVRAEFPYRMELPLNGQGLALWFREPPHRTEPARFFSVPGNPVLTAVVRLGDGLTSLWLVHPPNPIGEGRRWANSDLVALTEQVALRGRSRIVVGDMNRTEGSPYFGDFLRETGLRDSRLGFGRQGSWPTWSPYRIPIDHAFLSPDLAVIDRRLGPDIGSDHRPLIVDIGPASPMNSRK